MTGIVVTKSFNQFVILSQRMTYTCQIPKTLKREIVPWPGDFVEFDEKRMMIDEVKPRQSLLARPRIANLEQLFIVMSVKEPDYSWPLVYRYLSYAIYHDVKPLLVVSKTDKLDEQSQIELETHLRYLTIPVIYFSKSKLAGIDIIKQHLPGRISAFAGQTGVGKSTIINTLSPDYRQTIGSYSHALGRGRHETKSVTLFPFLDGYIADTPGFSSLELDFGQDMLAQSFPGFQKVALTCKFPNCLHQNEAGCAITDGRKNGKIPQEVYDIYLEILSQLPFRKEHY